MVTGWKLFPINAEIAGAPSLACLSRKQFQWDFYTHVRSARLGPKPCSPFISQGSPSSSREPAQRSGLHACCLGRASLDTCFGYVHAPCGLLRAPVSSSFPAATAPQHVQILQSRRAGPSSNRKQDVSIFSRAGGVTSCHCTQLSFTVSVFTTLLSLNPLLTLS